MAFHTDEGAYTQNNENINRSSTRSHASEVENRTASRSKNRPCKWALKQMIQYRP